MDGTPLADARVDFTPVDPKLKTADFALTDPEGRFVVASHPKKPGLKPGKYKVFISKWVDRKTGQAPKPEEMEMQRVAGLLKNVVPARYSNKDKPALTAEVESGNTDLPPFELKRK
jgi:hypothetical protein